MSKNVRARGLSTTASIVVHAAVVLAILAGIAYVVRPGGPGAPREAGIRPFVTAAAAARAVPPETEEQSPQEVVAKEPDIRNATEADIDEDLAVQEVMEQTEALSDAPFEGPQSNNLLGTGGAAGGAAFGRGGPRARGTDGPVRRLTPSTLAAHAVRLKVGEDDALPLRRTRVDVRVHGFRARVTLDWTFANERDQTLEGTFQVRLPDGAVPAVLAFGPVTPRTAALARARDGTADRTLPQETTDLRFARFAPRARAARAYRETSRWRPTPVDPALLEWSAAGVFDARVWPLTRRQEHRVRFAYDVALQPLGDELVLRLDLPPGPSSLDVAIAREATPGSVTPAAPVAPGRLRWYDAAERTFTVVVPRASAPMLVGDAEDVGPVFAALALPQAPVAPPRASERAVFLFDLSGSAQGARRALQTELLVQVLERNRPRLSEFQVGFFDLETTWWRPGFTANTPEHVAALRSAVGTAPGGAATDLGAALEAASDRGGAYDVFLLSDGAATWGERDPRALVARASAAHPVFAYALATGGTDVSLLERLARHTGGAVVPVPGDHAVEAAAVAHGARPWRILDAAVEEATDVLLAGRPVALYPGQTLTVVGRGRPAPGAALVLDLERDGEKRRVSTPLAQPETSDLALGVYGGVAVAHLEQTDQGFADLARAYALHFGVVCSAVSLVMLDTDDAYARFGIDARADALAVKSSEPGRIAARTGAAVGAAGDPRAAVERWIAAGDVPGPGDVGPFRRLLALLPTEALRMPSRRRAAAAAVERALGGPSADVAVGAEGPWEGVFAAADEQAAGGSPFAALRTLSGLVERSPGDAALLRAVAYRAFAWGHADVAQALFHRTLDAPPGPAHALAGMGAALAAAGAHDLAMLAYEAALASAQGGTDPHGIALGEYVALLRAASGGGATGPTAEFARDRLRDLAAAGRFAEADLVVTIAWNTDQTDVDLHVEEPSGEVCDYGHTVTRQGGRISADERRGLGPERYVLERAGAGEYRVRVKYFRSDERRTSLASHVLVTVVEDWGRPTQRVTHRAVSLERHGTLQEVARIRR